MRSERTNYTISMRSNYIARIPLKLLVIIRESHLVYPLFLWSHQWAGCYIGFQPTDLLEVHIQTRDTFFYIFIL